MYESNMNLRVKKVATVMCILHNFLVLNLSSSNYYKEEEISIFTFAFKSELLNLNSYFGTFPNPAKSVFNSLNIPYDTSTGIPQKC